MMRLNPVFSRLKKRTKQGLGLNICICGEPGKGKSRRGLRIGELFDLNGFNKKKVVYDGEGLIKFLVEDAKKGDCIFWDENIGSEATSWYTDTNKAVKRSMNIMRKKGVVFIQAFPSLLDLQSGCRRLFHIYIEPMDFFPLDDGYLCKVMQMQHNPQNKITYFKYFKIKDPKNPKKRIRVHRIFIKTPDSKELTDYYESESEKEKDNIHVKNLDIIRKDNENKQKDWRATLDIDEDVMTVLNNTDIFISIFNGKKYIDKAKIQNILNKGESTAKRIKKAVESRINPKILQKEGS